MPFHFRKAGIGAGLGRDLQAGQQMGQFQQVAQNHFGIGAQVVLLPQLRQGGGHIALHQILEQIIDPHPVGQTQHFTYLFRRDLAAAMGDGLVQQRETVTHRAFGGAGDQVQRLGLRRGTFGLDNAGEMADQQLGADPAQIKALTARQHGDRQLARFRGGEDELYVAGRLFQGFQQGIEGLGGEHVHFIDDVDLVAGRGGQITHAFQ